jgi:ketosteroid isomerase-like protein
LTDGQLSPQIGRNRYSILKDGRGAMDATAMLREFCDAVERQDGRRFANLFCEDGVYHDAFYGEFVGQAKIAEMINDWFFKSATDMRWDMHDPGIARSPILAPASSI